MSVYRGIADCVERNDVECLARFVNTPEFQYLASELVQKGFSVQDVVGAVAVAVSMVGDVPDVKASVELVLDTYAFSGYVREGRYMDALNMVLSRPGIVSVINFLNRLNLSVDDVVYSLAMHALDDERNISALKDIASRYQQYSGVISTAVRHHIVAKVEDLCSKDVRSAIEYLKNISASVDRDTATQAYAALMRRISESGDESMVDEAIALGRALGLFTADLENSVAGEASTLLDSVLDASMSALFDEVRSAIESGDPSRISDILNRYGEILSMYPVTVAVDGREATIHDVSLAEYLATVARYLSVVRPMESTVSTLVQQIAGLLESAPRDLKPENIGDVARIYSEVERAARAVVDALNRMSSHIDVLGLLEYVSRPDVGRGGAAESVRKRIEDLATQYRDLADYASAVNIYASAVYPSMQGANSLIEEAGSDIKSGRLSDAASKLRRAVDAMKRLLQHVDVISELMYRQLSAAGQSVSRGTIARDVLAEITSYIDHYTVLASYLDALDRVERAVRTGGDVLREVESLREFFNVFPDSRRIYGEYRLFYGMKTDDVLALLGEGRSQLIDELRSLGVLDQILSERRREIGTLIVATVGTELARNPEICRRIVSLAVARGYNGELSRLNRLFTAIDEVAAVVSAVDRVLVDAAGGGLDAIERALPSIENAVEKLNLVASRYGQDLSSVSSDGATLLDSVRSTIDSLRFIYGIYSTYTNTYRRVSSLYSSLSEAQSIDDQIRISTEIARVAADGYRAIERICSVYKQNADRYAAPFKATHQQFIAMASILGSAKAIDANTRDLLDVLGRGFRYPDEIDLVASRWGNILRELRTLKTWMGMEGMERIAEQIYGTYIDHLKNLKSHLVSEDIRMEDVLNRVEEREGLSIEYTRPYISAPVVAQMEKTVKIGLKMLEDWSRRTQEVFNSTLPDALKRIVVPLIGSSQSIMIGFLSGITSILRPYEIWQQIEFMRKGSEDFIRSIARGDVRGAISIAVRGIGTTLKSIWESVSRDPARFIGSMIGAAILAVAGAKIVDKLYARIRIPMIVRLKPLVINVLQGDPLGLAIDYIISPIVRFGISRFAVIWNITRSGAAKILSVFAGQPLRRILDAVGNRITKLADQLRGIATVVKAWGGDLSKLVQTAESIKNRKGVWYLRALVDRVLEINAGLRDIYGRMESIASDIRKKRQLSAVVKAAALESGEGIKAVYTMVERLRNVKRILGLELSDADVSRILSMDLASLTRLRNSVLSALKELSYRADMMHTAINRFTDSVMNNYGTIYRKYIDDFKRIRELGRTNPVKSVSDAAELITRIAREYNVGAAVDIGRVLVRELQSAGLSDISSNLAKVVDGLGGSASALRRMLMQFTDAVAEAVARPLREGDISRFIRIDDFISMLKKGSDALDIGAVVKSIDDFARSLDNAINAIRSVDVADALRNTIQRMISGIGELKARISELGLKDYRYISEALVKLDELAKILSDRLARLDEAVARLGRVAKPEDVAELARSLGLKDVAYRILRERMDLQTAARLVSESISLRTIRDVADVAKRLSGYIGSIIDTPQFTALRALLSNVAVSIDARIPGALLTDEMVSMLKEFRSRYGSMLPRDVLSQLDNAVNSPTVENFMRFVGSLGSVDPRLAAQIDLGLVFRLATSVEDMLRLANIGSIDMPLSRSLLSNLSAALDKVKRLPGIKVEVGLKLVDPGLAKAVAEAGEELKRTFRFMSKNIDDAVSKLQRFLELIDRGDFDSAAKMYGDVRSAVSFIGNLGLAKSILDSLREGFAKLRNSLLKAFGRDVPDTASAKVVSDAVKEVSSFLERFGVVEARPGYGFLASSVDDVVGFTMRAPIESLDAIREILSTKQKTIRLRIDGYDATVYREVSRTPMGMDIRYRFETPNGRAVFEVRISTVSFDPATKKAVNSVIVNAWYDPPLEGSRIADLLSKRLRDGLDWLRGFDPDIEHISRIVTYTPSEVSLAPILSRAATLLASIMLTPVDRGASALMSQPSISFIVDSLPSIEPVPDSLFDELLKIGVVPIGRHGNIVVGYIERIQPEFKFIAIRLPGEQLVAVPAIPRLGIIVVPVYKPAAAEIPQIDISPIATVDLSDLVTRIARSAQELEKVLQTPVAATYTATAATTPPQPIQIKKPEPQIVTVPQTPVKPPPAAYIPRAVGYGGYQATATTLPPPLSSTGRFAAVSIGEGIKIGEKLQI